MSATNNPYKRPRDETNGHSSEKRSRIASDPNENGLPSDDAELGSGREYLDQIRRENLDFDMEKVCSVTLWPRSVFGCLVCGKFFQGKSSGSPLYKHALESGHSIAINLSTGTVCSMPDGRNIHDSSLEDIQYNLKPVFTESDLEYFRQVRRSANDHKPPLIDYYGNRFYPGLLGMNDLGKTDYINSVVQALARITPLRNFFLLRSNWDTSESRIVRSFGELLCHLFNPKRFKSTLSPNEFVQAVVSTSGSRFEPGKRRDAKEFCIWLLSELHKGCVKVSGSAKSSIIHECFQGQVRVETTLMEIKRDFTDVDMDLPVSKAGPSFQQHQQHRRVEEQERTRLQVVSNKVERVPFMLLGLDVPRNALFTDEVENQAIIPHATLLDLLSKYDGATAVDVNLPGGRLEQKRYLITRLPPYLLLHLNRFSKREGGDSSIEKNRALVTLPLSDLDMRPFVEHSTESAVFKFNLVASVCHDGGVGPGVRNAVEEGTYKAETYYPPRDAWFEMDNVNVKHVDMPQLVAVAESYLAFYEQQDMR